MVFRALSSFLVVGFARLGLYMKYVSSLEVAKYKLCVCADRSMLVCKNKRKGKGGIERVVQCDESDMMRTNQCRRM